MDAVRSTTQLDRETLGQDPAFRLRLADTINRCATAFFDTTGCRRQMDRLRFLAENVEPLRLAITAGTSLEEIKPLFEKMKEAINAGTLAVGHPIEAGLGSSFEDLLTFASSDQAVVPARPQQNPELDLAVSRLTSLGARQTLDGPAPDDAHDPDEIRRQHRRLIFPRIASNT